MDGIIVINKEENMTSRDVVNVISKKLDTKKVGHTGTLDPMAKGVLVIAVNKALRIVEDLTSLNKEYIAEVTLGIDTDTLDITGNIIKKETPRKISNNEVVQVLNSFLGTYIMEVPKYSAIKVNGRKLYEYARNNEEVKLPIKEVYINNIELVNELKYFDSYATFSFKCNVSKGTYIRSLVRDICKRLDVSGTMSDLIRTKQGKFCIENSIKLSEVDENIKLITIKEALDLPMIEIDENLYKKVSNGCKLNNIYDYEKFCFIYKNNVVAIYIIDNENKNIVKPRKVFR